tara:strand:+ start:60 stop:326 length:267 start_codon:yes stop_codon:yes gene_type:complete
MEKIIFFGLIIPILIFVLYLGGKAIMTGFSAKSANRSNLENETSEEKDYLEGSNENLTTELNKLNELYKSGVLTEEEFEKAKKKILEN